MYKHIMVPLDGSALAECVLPHVDALAKVCLVENVTFVRVLKPIQFIAEDVTLPDKEWKRLYAEERAESENYLKQLVSRLKYDKVNKAAFDQYYADFRARLLALRRVLYSRAPKLFEEDIDKSNPSAFLWATSAREALGGTEHEG